MEAWTGRTARIVGQAGVARLASSSVLVFGVGGVGGYAVEALARAGVGRIGLVDNDTVSESNRNRQLVATTNTTGRLKTDVLRERVLSINPAATVDVYPLFYLPDNADVIDFTPYDYIVDAVDTVAAKLAVIHRAKVCGKPVISAMGAGNKLGTEPFVIADIAETHTCPLAKALRKRLKEEGITDVKVVYSTEKAIQPVLPAEEADDRVPGSISYVPGLCGLTVAGAVIRDLLREEAG
ncbi:MAG: tRNA threonylcarbamoyladenosine dehydratase [Eubacteriales bacterium]|nr:tRNA threonylcarbamoyladenosine dehydratase [Eubacteriales bacterium]